MTRYGYSRTSTDGQDGKGQVHKLTESGINPDHIFLDKGISGMKPAASRPEFARMNAQLQAGDSVTVPELSRMGRSVRDVLGVIEDFESRGITLKIVDLGLDLSTDVGRLVTTVLLAVARIERDFVSTRTKASLAAIPRGTTHVNGKGEVKQAPGRPRTVSAAQVTAARAMRDAGIPVGQIAESLSVPRSSLYRHLRD